MILSNTEILAAIENQKISISPIAGRDPTQPPFNTSAIDLRLASEIIIPSDDSPAQLDLSNGKSIASFWHAHSRRLTITYDQPYSLQKNTFVLARTMESVAFPICEDGLCYSARIEGKSSLARCGLLVHFTAPTIHSGFEGTITLEIINLGPMVILLKPGTYICQLIIEEVKGTPFDAPNQFKFQNSAVGVISK